MPVPVSGKTVKSERAAPPLVRLNSLGLAPTYRTGGSREAAGMASLAGKRVALLVAGGSEQSEVTVLREVLAEAGAEAVVVSPKKLEVQLWMNIEWGDVVSVDTTVLDAQARDYDALIIPGGLIGADTLRIDRQAVQLVRDFLDRRKPVGAMGHAVWVLIEAEAIAGRMVTSLESIRTDVVNAGGTWLDDAAVLDRHVITGRHHHDLPDFMAAMAEELARD